MFCDCYCYVPLPLCAVNWFVVCDCGRVSSMHYMDVYVIRYVFRLHIHYTNDLTGKKII